MVITWFSQTTVSVFGASCFLLYGPEGCKVLYYVETFNMQQ